MYIFNTKTKTKDLFTAKDNQVSIYVCGVTVYDNCHLGHARTYVAFDMIVRYLKHLGFNVTYVRNITDIDDKIIARSKELNVKWGDLTTKYITEMHKDFTSLNLLPASKEPRATDYIQNMIDMIEKLISLDAAYVASNNDVYYDLSKFNNYGQLSNRTLEPDNNSLDSDTESNLKKNNYDFALWKITTNKDEPSWESPWGNGRPGWHLECSAMSLALLGESFTIHGGGLDLAFPHHENECAQSEIITKKSLADYWMHTGFLQINKEKMSKSLGNFTTIKDALQKVNPEVLRFFFLSSHYRNQLDFSEDKLLNAKKALDKLYISIRDNEISSNFIPSKDNEWLNKFDAAMQDDFNTSLAISYLFEISKLINKETDLDRKLSLMSILKYLANIIGLLYQKPDSYLESIDNISLTNEEIESLIDSRQLAKKNKDFTEADRIRNHLHDNKIIIEDLPHGKVTWRAL